MCVILLLKPLSLDNFIKKYSQLFFTQLSISICIIMVEVVNDEILYELLWFPSLFMNLLYALQFHRPGLFSSLCLFPLFLFSILAYSHKISQYSRNIITFQVCDLILISRLSGQVTSKELIYTLFTLNCNLSPFSIVILSKEITH